jgi:hypothetical protein
MSMTCILQHAVVCWVTILVYAHECALLVNFCVYDTKKNLGGCTGYPKNYWNPVFVSPKYSKRLGYARYHI